MMKSSYGGPQKFLMNGPMRKFGFWQGYVRIYKSGRIWGSEREGQSIDPPCTVKLTRHTFFHCSGKEKSVLCFHVKNVRENEIGFISSSSYPLPSVSLSKSDF